MTGKKASAFHDSTPTSLDIFLFRAKEHCRTLEGKDGALLNTYRIFAYNMDISTAQYRRINALMQQVGETVEALCILLSDPESLPQSVRSYHYLPLVTFQYVDEQVQTILSLLTSICQLHKTSSVQKDKLKKVMHNKIKSLRQDLHEGLGHVQDLADQALLAEKRKKRSFSPQPQEPLAFPGVPHS